MSQWSFEQSVAYLESLPRHQLLPVRDVGLQRIRFLLERIGDPQLTFAVVHVAGSTGKGSTTALVAEGLRQAGHTTGLFRSPHLVTYRERIQINGFDIDEAAWLRAFERVWPAAEAMGTNGYPGYSLGRPSHGEILLAMAVAAFAQAGVTWAVLETGMGGRLDATNAVPSVVAVVTNVSLEHTSFLGSTVPAIAQEKAAIVKSGAVAVSGSRDPVVTKIVRDRAAQVGARFVDAADEVRIVSGSHDLTGQDLEVEIGTWHFGARLALAGAHQRDNAAAALATLWILAANDPALNPDAVRRAMGAVSVPGRLEVIERDPLVLLDGAQSTAGTLALREAIDSLLPGRKVTLLFAAMADKDLASMAANLAPRAELVIATRAPGAARAAGKEAIERAFATHSSSLLWYESAERALSEARRHAASEGVLVVAGSLYLVGWVRKTVCMERASV